MFQRLSQLEKIRKEEKPIVSYADAWTMDTWDESTLAIGRYYDGDKIIGVFNFSEYDRMAWINEDDGLYEDFITGQKMQAVGVKVPAHGFYYLKKVE